MFKLVQLIQINLSIIAYTHKHTQVHLKCETSQGMTEKNWLTDMKVFNL